MELTNGLPNYMTDSRAARTPKCPRCGGTTATQIGNRLLDWAVPGVTTALPKRYDCPCGTNWLDIPPLEMNEERLSTSVPKKSPQSSVSDGRAGENTASTVGPPSDAPAAEREKPGETGKPNLASK